jgi:hypothetical protein
MSRLRTPLVVAATVAGLGLGWLVAQRTLRHHSAALFSSRPLKRLAALGYLEGAANPDSLRLLRDYLGWEHHQMLRRKATALVRRLEGRAV